MKEPDTLKPRTDEAKAFVDLARKVFSVPKKEIDRRQAEYERERKHGRKKAQRS
jgi:hypothetical protein